MENIQAPIPNTRWNFCGPPLLGFPDAAENAVSDGVGQLIYDQGEQRYKWIDDRPEFINLVKSVFSEPDLDRCHSVSWDSLLWITIDLLLFDQTGAGVQYLTSSMISMFSCWKDYTNVSLEDEDRRQYCRRLMNDSQALIAKIKSKTQDKNVIAERATNFLTTLNSCIFNLRYPCDSSVHWNQSVNSAYDPYAWFFVNESRKVVNDQTGVFPQPKDFSEYGPLDKCPAPPGAGFYLPHPYDTLMIQKLCDWSLTAYLLLPRIYIYHGRETGRGHFIIASSSNSFPIPSLQQDSYPIYRKDAITAKWVEF